MQSKGIDTQCTHLNARLELVSVNVNRSAAHCLQQTQNHLFPGNYCATQQLFRLERFQMSSHKSTHIRSSFLAFSCKSYSLESLLEPVKVIRTNASTFFSGTWERWGFHLGNLSRQTKPPQYIRAEIILNSGLGFDNGCSVLVHTSGSGLWETVWVLSVQRHCSGKEGDQALQKAELDPFSDCVIPGKVKLAFVKHTVFDIFHLTF